MLRKLPDDPEIEHMDHMKKMWLFANWLEDQNEKVELLKNHGYLIGSFINPEAVKRMMGTDSTTYETTETEFEETYKAVEEFNKEERESKPKKKRKKKIILE